MERVKGDGESKEGTERVKRGWREKIGIGEKRGIGERKVGLERVNKG